MAIAFQNITSTFSPRWLDHPLIYLFSRKLRENIRFELTARGSIPTTFPAYVAAAISVEQNQAAAALSHPQPSSQPPRLLFPPTPLPLLLPSCPILGLTSPSLSKQMLTTSSSAAPSANFFGNPAAPHFNARSPSPCSPSPPASFPSLHNPECKICQHQQMAQQPPSNAAQTTSLQHPHLSLPFPSPTPTPSLSLLSSNPLLPSPNITQFSSSSHLHSLVLAPRGIEPQARRLCPLRPAEISYSSSLFNFTGFSNPSHPN